MANRKLNADNLEELTQGNGTTLELLNTLSGETKELILDRNKKVGRGRPKTGNEIGSENSDYIRATSVVNKRQWAKLQTIAKMEGVSLKTLLESIYALSIQNYENKKGEVKVDTSTTKDLSKIFDK